MFDKCLTDVRQMFDKQCFPKRLLSVAAALGGSDIVYATGPLNILKVI
jgi:hypothetical protein